MDNFDKSNFGNENPNKPILPQGTPYGASKENFDKTIPFDNDDNNSANVSHSPLNLGSAGTAKTPNSEIAPPPVNPAFKKTTEKPVSTDRITGVKSFFTKLHPGALEFLDEQISLWLHDNPGIDIKRTNTATGEVQGKKTEPNIIITVWY